MELKSIDKGNRETTASVSPLPRDMPDKCMDDDGTGIMDRRPSSFISEWCGA
jgi:hypothetical protein